MSTSPAPARPAAAAPEADALVAAMEREIAAALAGDAPNPAIAQLLGSIRARAAKMAPATGPPPPPSALAASATDMGKDLDALEDLLEALQLFASRGP
jgi:hypothetical protein